MPRRLGALLREALAPRAELAADQERREAASYQCCAVADLTPRRRGEVYGVLRSVTLRPKERVQALEAELYDGSGSMQLVWLGRRAISGIEPGRRGRFSGLVSEKGGRKTMYNPRYELTPRPGE
jgi:hypothetical protein